MRSKILFCQNQHDLIPGQRNERPKNAAGGKSQPQSKRLCLPAMFSSLQMTGGILSELGLMRSLSKLFTTDISRAMGIDDSASF